ncbi:hypothetical protein [Streptomyces sp. NPDC048565]|uniref:hypothetical protein n=1 Tax=Streptomyces sp. NPDC048565 TaxID=3155266 RepID=UPI00343A324A
MTDRTDRTDRTDETDRTDQADPDVEQADQREMGAGPWWVDLKAWGGVVLIAFGALAVVWLFFRLPGAPEGLGTGYYSAAKVIAIGLVIVGSSTLTGLRRGSGDADTDTEKPDATAEPDKNAEPDEPASDATLR